MQRYPAKCAKVNKNCRLPAWLALIGVACQSLVSNEEFRSESLQAFFDADEKCFHRFHPDEDKLPQQTQLYDDPILRDVAVKQVSIRDMLRITMAVFSKIDNRVESTLQIDLRNENKIERCIVVSYSMAYLAAK